MKYTMIPRLVPAVAALVLSFAVLKPAMAAGKVTIVNRDGAGEGFNDPTPVPPVGGNLGTTLGQQRLIVFRYAANIWGAALDSPVPIRVGASFDPLSPWILGGAGATRHVKDFVGAKFPATWYNIALGNKLSGADLIPGFDHIGAVFNSNATFYLGLDNNASPEQADFLAVVLHELGHGMGFGWFGDETTGENALGFADVYSQFILDTTTGKLWPQMTNAERKASATNIGHVAWSGPHVGASVPSVLDFGVPALSINSPWFIARTVRAGAAFFGPPLSAGGITGNVVQALDAGSSTTDACSPLTNGAAVAGNIALVDASDAPCYYTVKVKNAQSAGAVAVVVVDNLPYAPPLDMVGADPTITIPSVIITKGDGYVIKSLLRRHSIVNVTMLLDLSIRAGADPADRALLYASNPVEPGSSISHWEAIASPNQIMEPYLNPHEPHVVIPPADMTLPLLRDIGWFLDENLDGRADTTVMVGQCNSGVPNANVIPGVTIADQVKACAANPSTHSRYVSCVSKTLNAVSRAGIITVKQQAAIQTCANNASIP